MIKRTLSLFLCGFLAFSSLAFALNNDVTFDDDTKLLLHMDGSGLTDSSFSSRTATLNGSITNSNTQSKFGGYSASFDGSTQFETFPNSSDFEFGSGDFTVSWWEYRTGNTTLVAPAIQRDSTTTYSPFIFGNYYSVVGENWVFITSDGANWDIASSKTLGTVDLNTWNNFEIVRSGNTFYTFKNGTQSDTWTSSAAIFSNSNDLSIGKSQGLYYFQGFIDEVRVVKGIAVHTGGTNGVNYFTPQTNAYRARRITSTM